MPRSFTPFNFNFNRKFVWFTFNSHKIPNLYFIIKIQTLKKMYGHSTNCEYQIRDLYLLSSIKFIMLSWQVFFFVTQNKYT